MLSFSKSHARPTSRAYAYCNAALDRLFPLPPPPFPLRPSHSLLYNSRQRGVAARCIPSCVYLSGGRAVGAGEGGLLMLIVCLVCLFPYLCAVLAATAQPADASARRPAAAAIPPLQASAARQEAPRAREAEAPDEGGPVTLAVIACSHHARPPASVVSSGAGSTPKTSQKKGTARDPPLRAVGKASLNDPIHNHPSRPLSISLFPLSRKE